MKRLLTLFIFILCLIQFSCIRKNENITFSNTNNFKTISKVNYPNELNRNEVNYLKQMNELTEKIVSKIFTKDMNYVFSPISLYMALSMVLEGADGQTKDELTALLGVDDVEALSNNNKQIFNNNYYNNNDGLAQMANSLWIEQGCVVKDDYINVLSESYYCSMYSANFREHETHQNIVDWINHYTKDLLKLTTDNYEIDEDLSLLLLNTIYFDNLWSEEFDTKDTKSDTFYANKEKINKEFMHHTVSTYYLDDKKYEAIKDYFKNDNSITYILPKEGYTIIDILNQDFMDNVWNNTNYPVRASIKVPKFDYTNKFELNDVLKELGLVTLFNSAADLSKISSGGLYVSYVKQDTGIILSEKGVKAAAVTSIGMEKSASMEEYKEFILNRPFIYIINDKYGIPLFIGSINR